MSLASATVTIAAFRDSINGGLSALQTLAQSLEVQTDQLLEVGTFALIAEGLAILHPVLVVGCGMHVGSSWFHK